MKIRPISKRISFGPILVTLKDMESIYEKLPESKLKEIVVDGIEYDNIEELREKCGDAREASISSYQPSISVNFGRYDNSIYISDQNGAEYGNFVRIVEYIRKMERKPRVFYKIFPSFLFLLIAGVLLSIVEYRVDDQYIEVISSILRYLTFVWYFWVLYINLTKRVVFKFGDVRPLLHGKRVDLGIAISAAIFGAIFGAAISPIASKYVGDMLANSTEKK